MRSPSRTGRTSPKIDSTMPARGPTVAPDQPDADEHARHRQREQKNDESGAGGSDDRPRDGGLRIAARADDAARAAEEEREEAGATRPKAPIAIAARRGPSRGFHCRLYFFLNVLSMYLGSPAASRPTPIRVTAASYCAPSRIRCNRGRAILFLVRRDAAAARGQPARHRTAASSRRSLSTACRSIRARRFSRTTVAPPYASDCRCCVAANA